MPAVELPGGKHVEKRYEKPNPRRKEHRREQDRRALAGAPKGPDRRAHEERLAEAPLGELERVGLLDGEDRGSRGADDDDDGSDGEARDWPADRDVKEYPPVHRDAARLDERAKRGYAYDGQAGYKVRPRCPEAVVPGRREVAELVRAEYAEQRQRIGGRRGQRVANAHNLVCLLCPDVPVHHDKGDDHGKERPRDPRRREKKALLFVLYPVRKYAQLAVGRLYPAHDVGPVEHPREPHKRGLDLAVVHGKPEKPVPLVN